MPGILDRYLLWIFARVMLVTFVGLTGMYLVIHIFSNVAEIQEHSKSGNLLYVLFDFYYPQILAFFDRTGPVMILLAAIFVVMQLMRTNELTAIMAAGVSKGRIVTPLICGAIALSALGVVNREWWIPQVRGKLVRKIKDLHGDQANPLRPTYDYKTDVFIGGRQTIARERKIVSPQFRLPGKFEFGTQLVAEAALYQAATPEHPAGYLFEHVTTPLNLPEKTSVMLNDAPLVITPRDAKWLQPHQCFLVSDVSFEQLAGGSYWRQLASTPELVTYLRNPSLELGNDARVALHSRFVQPLLDMALFVLGLPLVLGHQQRNMLASTAMNLGLIGGFFVVVIICQMLGINCLISPALAAWLPLMIFGPVAYATAVPLWQ